MPNQDTASAEALQRDHSAELIGTVTHDNLLAAFAREAQAVLVLELYARIAELEGQPETAGLMRELRESEDLFAGGHMDFLRQVGDPVSGLPVGPTPLNLAAMLDAAQTDAIQAFPAMASTARAEGFPDVASWFETLVAAKRRHASRLQATLGRGALQGEGRRESPPGERARVNGQSDGMEPK